MWSAVVRNGNAYQYADYQAVKSYDRPVELATNVTLQPYSFQLALMAVRTSNGMQLQHVPYDALGNDYYSRVVLSAVSINPDASRYVDKRFNGMQEIMKAVEARRNPG